LRLIPAQPTETVTSAQGTLPILVPVSEGHLADGLNIHGRMVTHAAVAEALKLPFVPVQQALKRQD
jgi:alanine dehydrogenase